MSDTLVVTDDGRRFPGLIDGWARGRQRVTSTNAPSGSSWQNKTCRPAVLWSSIALMASEDGTSCVLTEPIAAASSFVARAVNRVETAVAIAAQANAMKTANWSTKPTRIAASTKERSVMCKTGLVKRDAKSTWADSGFAEAFPSLSVNQAKFLAAYAQVGVVVHAAKAAGLSCRIHSMWMKASEEYRDAFEVARRMACDSMEAEARRRAVEGWREPIFQQGKLVGHRPRYSDTLLIFLMKGAMPEKYGDKVTTTHRGGGQGSVSVCLPSNGREAPGLEVVLLDDWYGNGEAVKAAQRRAIENAPVCDAD